MVLKAFPIATNLPVSATKPRRGPCHTICHLPALVGNGIKCHCCRCRAPPPASKSTKTLCILAISRSTAVHTSSCQVHKVLTVSNNVMMQIPYSYRQGAGCTNIFLVACFGGSAPFGWKISPTPRWGVYPMRTRVSFI